MSPTRNTRRANNCAFFVPILKRRGNRKLLKRLGVPDGTVLNRIVRVRERLYEVCKVFETH
jgi:hypothetical protein